MDEAFNPGRAIKHGIEGLKLAPLPLFVGAFIMGMTEGGGGSGNFSNLGDLANQGGGGGDDFDWEGGGTDWNYDLGDGLDGLLGQLPLNLQAQSSPADLFAGQSFGDPGFIAILAVGMVCVLVLAVAFFALRCWVHTGYIRLHKQVIETGEGDFGTLFSGGDLMANMALWKLLGGAISFGTIMVAALPGGVIALVGGVADIGALLPVGAGLAFILVVPVMIYVGLGLYLGNHAVVIEGLGPMAALERSWGMAKGNRVTLFVYSLVMGLFGFAAAIVGLLMCCIGVIVTGPAARAIVDVGLTEAFMLATGGAEGAANWRLLEVTGGLD
ncbi:MAG: hypothetical protein H6739_16040 [Alphaproteobacteria bacterium]|nr:hypothetical protein [Alphaproteobacteria bacterium]